MKKKKLKINVDRPEGLKFVFDEEGNALPRLAAYANAVIEDSVIEPEKGTHLSCFMCNFLMVCCFSLSFLNLLLFSFGANCWSRS